MFFKNPRTPCCEVQHILHEHHEPGAAWGPGDGGGTASQPSEISGRGGVQGLGFKSGRTTCVLTGGARVTLWSREQSVIPRGNAGKSAGRHLSWLHEDGHRLWWTRLIYPANSARYWVLRGLQRCYSSYIINPLQPGSLSFHLSHSPTGQLKSLPSGCLQGEQ